MNEELFSHLTTGAFLSLLALAMFWDLRARRIPNALTVGSFFVALLMRSLLGPDLLIDGLQGAGLALLFALPLFLLSAVGGGDVKLLVAVGAFVGPDRLLFTLALTALAGGAMALLTALRWGGLMPLLSSTGNMLKYFATFGRAGRRKSLALPGATSIPYGVAIAVGSTVAWFI
jgi:prepilin peptidase CpaA